MAGNENVIESLKLEIGVEIHGQDKLITLQSTLSTFTRTLETVNNKLREYANLSNTLRAVGLPQVETGQQSSLFAFSENLDRVNERLREYTELANNVNAINFPSLAEGSPSAMPEEIPTIELPDMTGVEAIAPAIDNVTDSVEELNESIGRTTETEHAASKGASALGQQLRKLASDVLVAGKSADRASNGLGKMVSAFVRIAKYRAIRAIIRGITEGLREGVQNLAAFDSSFNGTMSSLVSSTAYLKNAFGTLAQPLLEILIPVIVQVIDYIVIAINKINEWIAILQGKSTYTAAVKYTKTYASNMDKAAKSAKEIKRSLMGFDEINRLTDNASSAGGGAAGGVSPSQMFETRAARDGDIVETVRTALRTIERIAGAMLLAIGCVLLVTGHIGIGVACIIAGVTLVAASLKYGEAEDKVKQAITTIEAIVGTAFLAIGAILTFTGHIGVGIALMAIGVTALVGSVLLDWSSLNGKIAQVCSAITVIVSGALLAIGIILACASPAHMALGIALLAAGAVGLVASVVMNWSDMSERTKKVVTDITLAISGAMLAVGAVLALSGVNLPLGIALMAAGAVGLVAAVALNWNSTSERTKTAVGAVMAVLGGALLVVGAILTFSGVALPLGIGLMAAGGLSLGSAMALNWNALTQKFTEAFDKLKSKVTTKLAELKEKFQSWRAHLKAPHLTWQSNGIQTQGIIKKALEALNLPTTLPKLHVDWYAKGGFPEDGLFMANHGELVGQFANGRTAVANNEQIEAGIEEAAYRGFMRAMGNNSGGTTTFIAQLNGKTLFEEVVRQNNNATKSYGSSPLTAF